MAGTVLAPQSDPDNWSSRWRGDDRSGVKGDSLPNKYGIRGVAHLATRVFTQWKPDSGVRFRAGRGLSGGDILEGGGPGTMRSLTSVRKSNDLCWKEQATVPMFQAKPKWRQNVPRCVGGLGPGVHREGDEQATMPVLQNGHPRLGNRVILQAQPPELPIVWQWTRHAAGAGVFSAHRRILAGLGGGQKIVKELVCEKSECGFQPCCASSSPLCRWCYARAYAEHIQPSHRAVTQPITPKFKNSKTGHNKGEALLFGGCQTNRHSAKQEEGTVCMQGLTHQGLSYTSSRHPLKMTEARINVYTPDSETSPFSEGRLAGRERHRLAPNLVIAEDRHALWLVSGTSTS
ncbi:hypothetical protein B0H17DRAFT_1144763 [Mycena rosella]|uniref:Uncharacterized protein n=1 Tax=Mycena rosella TaxID=1033263 RepID=A0AAD7G5D1_MYCRO|nr:hypothetical protein B0H17DRAFT_1144763 [Mycena rosella]